MIDTIKFKIVNVKERYNHAVGYMVAKTKDREYNFLRYRNLERDTVTKIKSGKIHIPSSSRDINYRFDKIWNELKFEFSVPKSLYGTNVYQFVPHRNDTYRMFVLTLTSSIKWEIENCYDRIIHFIKKFIEDVTLYKVVSESDYHRLKRSDPGLHLISMQDIEIERLDFCFNRIFNSEGDALKYLDLLKQIHKKHQRDDRNKSKTAYDTAVYIVNRNFTFKVYHKGYEFKKSRKGVVCDRRGLTDINNRLGYQKYNIERLQELAGRILRYEIEFRKTGMNYIYKSRMYKKNNKYWIRFKSDAMKYQAVQKKIDMLGSLRGKYAKLQIYLIKLGYRKYREAFTGLINEQKKYIDGYTFYNKAMGQTAEFCLEVTEKESQAERIVLNDELENYKRKGFSFIKNALFSKKLVIELGKFFMSFVDEYTLRSTQGKKLSPEEIIKDLIRTKEKLNPGAKRSPTLSVGFKDFIYMLDRMSIDEIKESKKFPKVTFYQYAKDLKLLGYDRRSLIENSIPYGKDFAEYYCEVLRQPFEQNLKTRYFS